MSEVIIETLFSKRNPAIEALFRRVFLQQTEVTTNILQKPP